MDNQAFIVEDDPDLGDIFAMAVSAAGYHTTVFHDGRAALRSLAETSPALIVLDLHLPGRSGPEVLDHIEAFGRNVPIIVCSADPRLVETVRDRVNAALIKPVGFVQLRETARKLRGAGGAE